MEAFIAWFSPAHLAVIFGVGWGLCEALNAIPFFHSNSVFEAIFSFFKSKQPPVA